MGGVVRSKGVGGPRLRLNVKFFGLGSSSVDSGQ